MTPTHPNLTLNKALKLASPGPLRCLPYDPVGSYDGQQGACIIVDQNGDPVAVVDEGDLEPLVGLGSEITQARQERAEKILLEAQLLVHSRNLLTKLIEALSQTRDALCLGATDDQVDKALALANGTLAEAQTVWLTDKPKS